MLVASRERGTLAAPPGPKAPGTLAEGEPHRPDILTLSPTLECWNEVFLVNTVEIPTTYFLLTDQSYRPLAAQMM